MFSKLSGFCFAACVVLLVERNEAGWAVAEFYGLNNITGAVVAGDGYVSVSVNISGLAANNYSAIGGPSCFQDDGFSYHIHEKWGHNNTSDKLTGDCGSSYTGGHWDPWLACGSATGNTYCYSRGGCINGSSVLGNQGYDCDSDIFLENPYACEVGDWSGKYGKASVDGDIVTALGYSPYEVNGGDLLNLSVVFHCNDGFRAFCAPFENYTSPVDTSRPIQGDGNSGKVAYLPKGDFYAMAYNGTNYGYFLPSSYDIPSDCDNLLYRIYDDWNSSMIYLSGNDNCSAAVGNFYDPTISCAYGSGSIYCLSDMIYLCNDSSYSYECDYSQPEDRFLCAPGDLSGKFGSIDSSESYVEFTEYDKFMIDLSLLDNNKSLVLQCKNTYEIIACGQFMDGNDITTTSIPSTTMTKTDDGYTDTHVTGDAYDTSTTYYDDDTSTTYYDDDTSTTYYDDDTSTTFFDDDTSTTYGDDDDDDDDGDDTSTTQMEDSSSTTNESSDSDSDNGFATCVQFGTIVAVTTTMIKMMV